MGPEEKIVLLKERLETLQEVLQTCVESIEEIRHELQEMEFPPQEAPPVQPAYETPVPEPTPDPGPVFEEEKETEETESVPPEHTDIPHESAVDDLQERERIETDAMEMLAKARHEINEKVIPGATVADRVNRQPLKDIKSAMGINERFLYANELFKGDLAAFNQAIEELNHLETKADADRLLDQQLSTRYQWDDESKYVSAFRDLVGRRFNQ